MKRFKKVMCLILCMAMIFGFAACGKKAPEENKEPEITTKIVKDVWGRELEVPAKVEKIVCLGSGAPRIAAYLDAVNLMVGVEKIDSEKVSVLRDYSPVYFDKIKSLPVVGAGGGSGSNNGYAEEIIKAAPDVILAGFSKEAADELQQQTGIPVVSVRYTSKGLANDTFYDAMRVFAETVGAQERCEKVLKFIDDCKADLNKRTAGVAADAKLRAYSGAVTFSGRHGFTGTYSQFGPFDVINAKNVADIAEKDGYYETDFEQVLTWDPDVIFLDPGNMDMVNDEIKTNPTYFKSVRAISEGHVYTMPSFNNCGMNMSYALMDAYYAGTVLFPEQFADIDMAKKSAEILTMFIGADTYKTMADNGLYYGELKLD